MKTLAEARSRRTRAVSLAAEGMSYDQIARNVGYSHRGSAHRAVFQALAEQQAEAVDSLRCLEGARLDDMLSALWPDVERGDTHAIEVALKITDRRMKLLGLDKPNLETTHPSSEHSKPVTGDPEGNTGRATPRRSRRLA